MATLALGIVGSYFGPVGGFIGAAVGGIIDNYLLYPALFPQPDQKGPRLDGINITSANEGTPMNWSLGPRVSIGGTILWMSNLEEVEKEIGGKGGGPSQSTYEYFVTIAIGFGEAKPQTISRIRQILADVKSIYSDGATSAYDDIRIYDGSQTTPDPYLESVLGAGKVPAFINQCYVVIERQFLGDFGNRVPNYQSHVEQSKNMSVGAAIAQIMARCGFSGGDYATDNVSYCLRGINFSGPVTGLDMLQTILGTYSVSVQEVDGKFRFFDRGGEVAITVDRADFAIEGSSSGLSFDTKFDKANPDEVAITFISDDLDLQPGATRYRDQSRVSTSPEHQVRFDTPATLSSVEANQVARRQYWQLRGERMGVSFSLPAKYGNIAAGDVVSTTFSNGDPILVRVSRAEYGVNGQVAITGVRTWPDLFTQSGFGDESGYFGVGDYHPPTLVSYVADMAAISAKAIDEVTVYWGSRLLTPTQRFRGASLFTSPSGDAYTARSSTSNQLSTGTTVQGPRIDADAFTWDDASELIVDLDSIYFTPSSASDSDVLSNSNSRNIIAVENADGDWEIMGFVNVTMISATRAKLTRLLRGLRGTEYLIPRHQTSSARVLFLSGSLHGALATWAAGDESIGDQFTKVVAYQGLLSSVDPEYILIKGRSMRPFAPTNLRYEVSPDLSGNWDVTLSWRRRSKRLSDPFASNAGPLATDEKPEQYRVEIRVGGPASTLLYEEFASSPSFFFSRDKRLAAQVASGYVWGIDSGTFMAYIYQISTAVGDSPVASLFVPARPASFGSGGIGTGESDEGDESGSILLMGA